MMAFLFLININELRASSAQGSIRTFYQRYQVCNQPFANLDLMIIVDINVCRLLNAIIKGLSNVYLVNNKGFYQLSRKQTCLFRRTFETDAQETENNKSMCRNHVGQNIQIFKFIQVCIFLTVSIIYIALNFNVIEQNKPKSS